MNYNDALDLLKKYNQEHVLKFYNELNDDEKLSMLSTIESIDFNLINNLYNNTTKKNDTMNVSLAKSFKKSNVDKKDEYIKLGTELIRNGKLAVCSMAGGQGTRLGHNGPKGTFMVDINPPKSIFEILTDKLKSIYEKYNVYLNWYIMTSSANNDDTVKFFKENSYFNYPKEYIRFFKQGELPLLDFNGKIALKSKGSIYMAANGNGGVFESLYKNDILKDMHEKGIEYLSIGNVDNILINQTDELLLGMMEDSNYDLASKSIPKRSADEPVGVFCKIDGKPAVIEYSDIDKNLANMRDENGELVYGDAHIGCNFFSLKLLDNIGNKKLPYHTAKKKNQILNIDGEEIIPIEPNTYKYEAFIFDSFLMANDILVLQGKREEEFAPIKNAEGDDSPETAKKLYVDFYNKNNHD